MKFLTKAQEVQRQARIDVLDAMREKRVGMDAAMRDRDIQVAREQRNKEIVIDKLTEELKVKLSERDRIHADDVAEKSIAFNKEMTKQEGTIESINIKIANFEKEKARAVANAKDEIAPALIDLEVRAEKAEAIAEETNKNNIHIFNENKDLKLQNAELVKTMAEMAKAKAEPFVIPPATPAENKTTIVMSGNGKLEQQIAK
jgi:hypothetical protein